MSSINKGDIAQNSMMMGGALGIVGLVLPLVMLYVSIVITIKRLRNAGLSPWLVILYFVPVVNLLLFIYLLIVPSKES